MKKSLLFILGFCILTAGAAIAQPRISKVRFEVIAKAKVIEITYDVFGIKMADSIYVRVMGKTSGNIIPRTLSGAVGRGVKPGSDRKIYWDVVADVVKIDEEIEVKVFLELADTLLIAARKKTSAPQTRPKIPQPVGIALTAEAHYAIPILNNGNGKVNTAPKLNVAGGVQLIGLPTKMISPTVGINFLPVRIATTNAAKTARLENFDFDLLQIPVGLRLSKPLGNSDFDVQLHGGVTLNLPRNINYTNHLVDIATTDAALLRPQTLGFYGGIGISRALGTHRSVSLMFNYQRTDNLLNLDYKDTATNPPRAALAFQSLSIQLIFKVF